MWKAKKAEKIEPIQEEQPQEQQQYQQEIVEVVEVKKYQPTTAIRVSLSTAEFPKVEKCCFIFDLRLALNAWLSIEAIIWTFLFIAAFYYEVVYIDQTDLLDFIEETEEWYFYLLFGDRLIELDQRVRTYIIIINLILMLIFLTYLAFCVVLIFGINMRKPSFFLPYFVLDSIFCLLAFIGCFAGLICSNNHLFRMCFIFLIIKAYVELCAVSLFIRIHHEKSKMPSPIDTGEIVFEDTQATAV